MTENKINKPAIQVKHLFHAYNFNTDEQFVSLCDNNLTIENNKVHFIIGSSGCGKSTLVNHFNGLLTSKFGNIIIDDNIKIGNDFFVNDLFIGIVKSDTIPQNFDTLNNNELIVAFSQKTPRNLIRFLFEAYYKIKIDKIKSIKNDATNNIKLYKITIFNLKNELEILNFVNWKDIASYSAPLIKNLWWKFISKNKKIKKVKNLKREVGLVFQFPEYQLFKDTVLNDVIFGPITLGEKKDIARNRSIEYLKKLKINESLFANSPFNLSGGQKRRVAIAGILAFNPQIVIFDEPSAGLDPQGEREIMETILSLKNDGRTIIVISHNMDHVLEYADNVIVMNDGEIVSEGAPYDIFTNKTLLQQIQIDEPHLIKMINKMVQMNLKFKSIINDQPRNIDQLVNGIRKVIKL